jgi:hypothetical protein
MTGQVEWIDGIKVWEEEVISIHILGI